jgi:2,4-dienoyl-CoA reductase-like NADH-dependent reductase (Old Yellow Enzyme family)
MTASFSRLFEPVEIGGLPLASRFVMPGMQRGWCRDGIPSPSMAEYYAERVAGGNGLVISESCAVDDASATLQPLAAGMTARTQRAWGECIDAVRREGGRMLIQLWHEGALRNDSDGLAISPSGLVRSDMPNGRAATRDELERIKAAFVRSAAIAIEAGADGVEIHAAHGYLLDQFLWSSTNQRQDGYGGDAMADRVRFPAEVVAAVREELGRGPLLSFRFSQWKVVDYDAVTATTPEELQTMVVALRQAGVDAFHVSTRWFHRPAWPGRDPRLGLSGWVKQFVDVPVIAVGGVGADTDVSDAAGRWTDAGVAAQRSARELAARLEHGDFDLVAVGRANIGDSHWTRKLRDGRFDEIRPFVRSDVAELENGWDTELVVEAQRRLRDSRSARLDA